MLSTWFIKNGSNPPQGGLSLITYDLAAHTAVERDLLTGLGKPVGIAVSGDTVYVSDQANNDIVKATLSTLLAASQPVRPARRSRRSTAPTCMAADADGTLYTKCNATGLCRIAPDGTISLLANDFQDARGVAVDAARHSSTQSTARPQQAAPATCASSRSIDRTDVHTDMQRAWRRNIALLITYRGYRMIRKLLASLVPCRRRAVS